MKSSENSYLSHYQVNNVLFLANYCLTGKYFLVPQKWNSEKRRKKAAANAGTGRSQVVYNCVPVCPVFYLSPVQICRRVRIEALKSQFVYWEEQAVTVTQSIFAVLKSCQHSAFLDNEVASASLDVFNSLFTTVTNLIATERKSESPKEEVVSLSL